MNTQELTALLSAGEDSFVEFKRDVSQRSDFAGEMIAFANSEGGRILVGVADDGTVVGVPDPQRVEENILNIARHNCKPPLHPHITRRSLEGKSLLEIEIPRRMNIPHENNSGQCFIRVGSTKRLATHHERARLLQLAGLMHYFVYHARISAARWAGHEAGEVIIDRQEITGRLSEQIHQAQAFIMRNTTLATKIEDVQQTDWPQYPRPALREAIVNAVAHRDYSLEGAQILLYIFDDRIELRSPGTLPNSVTLDNIRTHYSKPRNERIATALFNLGYVNTLGSGIPRMIRLMREHSGREPDFEVSSAQFLVRLWGQHD